MSMNQRYGILRLMRLVCVLGVLLGATGCASIVSNATSQFADNLSSAILGSNDVDTVREAIPAYLVLIDSLVMGDSPAPDLLLAAAQLNGAFTNLVEPERAGKLSLKALDYAARGACLKSVTLCDLPQLSFDVFSERVASISLKEVDPAYQLAVAWTGWIQANSDDWAAVGQLARVKALMTRVLVLADGFDEGGAHLYMGGLETVLPASMGGNPEKGKAHFERAIEYSDGRFLMAKVVYAEQYAKLVFDQALHDDLLNSVLAADPVAPNLTLINTLAQERAKQLMMESNGYF